MVPRGGEKVPVFDGRGASFLDYEQRVHLRMRTTRAELTARAPLAISRTQPAPRRECLAEGSAILDHDDGVARIFDILRIYFLPEAVDSNRQRVVRFTRFRRTDQFAGRYTVEYDLLRRKAESEMELGLAPRINSSRYCVWAARPPHVVKSPWLWRAAIRACGLRARRQICGVCSGRAGAEFDKML